MYFIWKLCARCGKRINSLIQYEMGQCFITFSINSMHANRSIPKSINAQLIPSFLYSSCSSTNMWWLKNCCNFSLVKLIHSCSKPLNYKWNVEHYFSNSDLKQFSAPSTASKPTSKISNPAMSRTPMNDTRFCCVSKVSLHLFTKYLNNLSNTPLDMAPIE